MFYDYQYYFGYDPDYDSDCYSEKSFGYCTTTSATTRAAHAAAAAATTAARDRPRPEDTAATGRDRARGIAAAGADRGRGLRETEGGTSEIIRGWMLVHGQSGELISSR